MTTSIARWAARRRTGTTQQFLAFQLYREWFALPIQVAHRVVPLGPTYGDPADQGIGLTHYHDREILVLDIKRRIFGDRAPRLPPTAPDDRLPAAPADSALVQADVLPADTPHLLIVHSRSGELVGLRLETLPTLRRAARATIAPLPPAYLAAGYIRCISALVVPRRGEAPLFLLNLDELLQPLTALPTAPALPAAEVRPAPDPDNHL